MNFDDLDYLMRGNQKQRAIFDLLIRNHVMTSLQEFDPILVGTFPINIDIETSDLDIICYWKNKNKFISLVQNQFGTNDKFSLRETTISGNETVVANFEIDHYAFEIFGQNIPVRTQYAYRHMMAEYEILKSKGEDFRKQVVELKKNGLKTEPAFAQLLGLKQDPYEELLTYIPVNNPDRI